MKFWYRGEPMIVDSLRYRIAMNDLLNEMRATLAEYKKFRIRYVIPRQ